MQFEIVDPVIRFAIQIPNSEIAHEISEKFFNFDEKLNTLDREDALHLFGAIFRTLANREWYNSLPVELANLVVANVICQEQLTIRELFSIIKHTLNWKYSINIIEV